ncbi:polyphosphate polymerase domain-containing protein [Glaciihabitans arcticus]|uniref:Polyphosphate polymerase domain-containing protein n=2 Tax=Glaciihabitans arcticus TaxID=2668039 RepID=A0A4V2JF84_9MICO|nr:polyphosphate polymerase domain-containing protein [Glaciihabitans arcticus]
MLEPISLEELTERASLLTRVDRKYLVPVSGLDALLGDLGGATRVLEIEGLRASEYRSVYFDTAGLDSYLAAARRRRRRFKVRTRTYLESAQCYLEVKTRGGRSLTVKERVEHPVAANDSLEGDDGYVQFALHEAGIDSVPTSALQPTLVTRYQRTTLFVPEGSSRATIDTALSWIDNTGHTIATPGLAVVETKSGSTASPVDRVLWAHGHRPANISKYGTGMAAMRPELPQNKWRRVLDRQLLPAVASTLSTPRSSS